MGEISEFGTPNTDGRRGGAEVPMAGVAAARAGPERASPTFTVVEQFLLPTLVFAIGISATDAGLAVVDDAMLDEDKDAVVTERAEREAAVGGAAAVAVVDVADVVGAPGASGEERDCWPAE